MLTSFFKKLTGGKFLVLIVAICLSLVTNLSAQEIEWQNTIGGSDHDFLSSIQQTTDGGYICGGGSMSNISGDKTENPHGGFDYWILKLDISGNIQWQKTIGGNNEDLLHFIKQTSDNGFICGGRSASDFSGNKTENCLGGYDYWVIKLDSIGNIQWQNTIGGSSNDYLNSLQLTYDGGYICGGYSYSGISSDKTEICLGDADYWIVKLDNMGIIQWENTIGGSAKDELTSIQQTTDDGYVLGGFSRSDISGDKTENSLGYDDYWVIKLDSIGNIVWQNTIGGDDGDILSYVQETTDAGYICGGFSYSNISGDKSENRLGDGDYWIIKLDSFGGIQWQNTIGGEVDDYIISIQQTLEGGYICGGYTHSNFSYDKTENTQGAQDYWVIKLNSIGNIEWQNTIGGSDFEVFSSIGQTADGGYICGGASGSNISGDKVEDNWDNSQMSYDYWIVKLTTQYNLIIGKTFLDLNSNYIHDPTRTFYF
ncbi:MAG: T9SS C-terminal target domain-containing protein [Bacteroidetes bacterium]|nr:T9SS C-terminal target domain-containing protein [Bacteroidota bacterium]